jgi:hypothetical protein
VVLHGCTESAVYGAETEGNLGSAGFAVFAQQQTANN